MLLRPPIARCSFGVLLTMGEARAPEEYGRADVIEEQLDRNSVTVNRAERSLSSGCGLKGPVLLPSASPAGSQTPVFPVRVLVRRLGSRAGVCRNLGHNVTSVGRPCWRSASPLSSSRISGQTHYRPCLLIQAGQFIMNSCGRRVTSIDHRSSVHLILCRRGLRRSLSSYLGSRAAGPRRHDLMALLCAGPCICSGMVAMLACNLYSCSELNSR